MRDITRLTILYNQSITEALQVIDKGAIRLAVVIDEGEKVIGTISDGDIRRALLKNTPLDTSIEEIYFKNPVLAKYDEPKEQIIQKAIQKHVYQIPIIDPNGRLCDIEDLATLISITQRKNRVILMAGGLGTRLRPLTQDTPKPLLKVGNKPILETIVKNFAQYGFTHITISVNYKSEMIKEYFGDGSDYGVKIDYIEEDKRLGTAGALSLIEDRPTEPFFVMNADLLTDVNFTHLLDFHHKEKALGTMCVREYDFQVPYGVIETNESDITSIVEKPVHKFFVNAGIYVLSPEVFDYIPQNEFYDMPTLFNTLIEKKQKASSFPVHEYWLDIGRMSDFEQAQNEYFRIFSE